MLFKATIYKSTGSWYLAKDEKGHFWKCRVKGKLKIDKTIRSTNPIAVGDIVVAEMEDEKENTAIISAIEPRTNYITRISPHNKNKKHIIASNLDQAIIIASIKSPKTSLGFIDRFLITAEMYGVTPIIVFNKIDLLNDEDKFYLNHFTNLYTTIGYSVLAISAEKNIGLSQIKKVIENKQTLFTGHSGVGKSTIINNVLPNLDLRTMQVSDWSGKGMHTTTYAEMFDLETSGSIIDTPGIRELGIVDIAKPELGGYFLEIKKYASHCKYNNCVHINEPNCAVLNAIQENNISAERYNSYLNILESIAEPNY